VLEAAVDLRVEVGQPPVDDLVHRSQATVYLGVPRREQPVEDAREPRRERGASRYQNDHCRQHGHEPTNSSWGVGRTSR
jgi:hypothetical protein